jgi:hypothetical protein
MPQTGTIGVLCSLSSRAAILPYIPIVGQALAFPDLPDFSSGDALIVAIVPFSYVFSHLDFAVGSVASISLAFAMLFPGCLKSET